MYLFESILSEISILNEEASVESINNAINNLHPVWITYDDQQGGGGKNRRQIYPVAYGLSSAGNPVIRAFQPIGSTKRGVPKWKLFRLDRIKMWRCVNSRTYDPNTLEGFNETGDEQIDTLYCIAPIGHAKEFAKIKDYEKNPPITDKPLTKNDIEQSNPQSKEKNTPDIQKTSNKKISADDVVDDILTNVSQTGEKNIDNGRKDSYFKPKNDMEKMEAPDPRPVNQTDIPGNEKEPDTEENETDNAPATSDNPISKEDLKGTEEMTASYKDMLNRMNNLYKEED